MGVKIYSENHEVYMSYFGEYALKRKIARAIGRDVSDALEYLFSKLHFDNEEELRDFNERLEKLWRRYKGQGYALRYIFGSSDVDGHLCPTGCKQVYDAIEGWDDNELIGYRGWGDQCSKVSDFKAVLKESFTNKKAMRWH